MQLVLGVSAQAVGIAEAAYREALKYAHDREQFGKTIVNFPPVYEMLSMMKAKKPAMWISTKDLPIYQTIENWNQKNETNSNIIRNMLMCSLHLLNFLQRNCKSNYLRRHSGARRVRLHERLSPRKILS